MIGLAATTNPARCREERARRKEPPAVCLGRRKLSRKCLLLTPWGSSRIIRVVEAASLQRMCTGTSIDSSMKSRARILLALVAIFCLDVLPAREALADRAVVVKTQDIGPYNLAVEGFSRSFDGEVIVIELDNQEVSSSQIREIRGQEPVAIIAIGSRAAISLMAGIDDIPIVYCMVMNAQDRGLSGPNITGVNLEIPALEQLASFARVVPELKRVGIVYNPERPNPAVAAAKRAADQAGVALVEKRVSRAGDVPDAAAELSRTVDGLWLLPDASLITNETFRHVLVTSLERRMPLFVFSAPFVRAGALMGLAPNYTRIGREAASIVEQVSEGETAGSIPTRDPPAALVINAATAARMGIELSAEVRSGATILQ